MYLKWNDSPDNGRAMHTWFKAIDASALVCTTNCDFVCAAAAAAGHTLKTFENKREISALASAQRDLAVAHRKLVTIATVTLRHLRAGISPLPIEAHPTPMAIIEQGQLVGHTKRPVKWRPSGWLLGKPKGEQQVG